MFSLKHFLHDLIFLFFFYLWLIYDFVKSKMISCCTYSRLISRIKSSKFTKVNQILSIGFGEYHAFSGILSKLPGKIQITGYDSNLFKLFRSRNTQNNVEVIEQKLIEIENKRNFDAIVFMNSIFPFEKTEKQINKAKMLLKNNGKIFFIVSLFKKKTKFLKGCRNFIGSLWGNGNHTFMTEKEFLDILRKNKLNINYKERIKNEKNPLFKVFRFFLIEAQLLL